MASKGTLLLVDDEAYVRDSLARLLERRGWEVRTAPGYDTAVEAHSTDGVDAVITDLRLQGRDGLEVLKRLNERDPQLPVVVLTGHGTVPSAVECVRAGAVDYLLKPADPDELEVVLERALRAAGMAREVSYLRAGGSGERPAGEGRGPLGESPAWKRVLELVELAAPADSNVLLEGETGSGKQEVAKLLHAHSPRAAAPFVTVNCAAIPDELFESEFFGHRRGAFTGAVSDREGRFRVAHRGTLLLDEVDALPARAQAKVLRVIESGEFERVGESRSTRVDVRLVCATNADLVDAVDTGRFRADLFYRIHVMKIEVPPLRDRGADVLLLAAAFLEEIAGRLGRPARSFAPDALEALSGYDWPGNVRELRNVVERAVLLARGETLTRGELPADILRPRPRRRADGEDGAPDDLNLRERLRSEERRTLEVALERAGGVKREAARLVGVDERNLAYYLRKHGLMGDRGE